MRNPDEPCNCETPAPDPKIPYALSLVDRVILRVLRIDPEDATTPYPERPHPERDADEGD